MEGGAATRIDPPLAGTVAKKYVTVPAVAQKKSPT